MSKKQPLNNRINKEAMFKKIMPSASVRQKAPERPAPSASGGDELLDGLSDNLIDLAVGNFGDDLLDQLPSQPRVFATPAAPTAPVPPPPSVSHPQDPLENYADGNERLAPQEAPAPQYAPPPEETPFMPQAPQQAQYPPQYPPAPQPGGTDYQQPPPQSFVPTQAQNQGYPPPGYVPTQPMPGYPAPYPYPYPPYPYPPQDNPYPPQEQRTPPPSEPAPEENDGMPRIEQMPSATVVADSASVVTDTVVIQENNPAPAAQPEPPAEAKPRPEPQAPEEEPEQPPHEFQPEMELEPEATHLLDDYDAFPPLSEGNGEFVNVAERIVSAWLDEAIARVRGCQCEKCRLDVAAFALNRIAPQYVLTDELTEEALCRRKTVAETVEILYKAAFQVKTFPRH